MATNGLGAREKRYTDVELDLDMDCVLRLKRRHYLFASV